MSNATNSQGSEQVSTEKYANAEKERQKHIDAILNSASLRKVVVAGPGTGKTYLFRQILQGKKKTLTLTFVNSLVEDLSLELCGMSEVRTLHSFARSELTTPLKKVQVFPRLSTVIKQDAIVLLKEEIDFDPLFHNRDDKNELVAFYKERKDYYEHYGYADIIFALVKYLEKTPRKIPAYEQIVVDEFQDFNKLEVSLIDLLAQKSPILLAGDDDQALYDFKDASSEHIRERHSAANSEYSSFTLPYCQRCTSVIVDAANDIIKGATRAGYLLGRIDKPFQYFNSRKKDTESNQNPKIIYARMFERQIPGFIEQMLGETTEQLKQKFDVLIISPFRIQSRSIVKALREKGLQNIDYADKQETSEPTLLDGLKLLLMDRKSNLGWRIAAKFVMDPAAFESILLKTRDPEHKSIVKILSKECKKGINRILKVLRAIQNEQLVEESLLNEVLKKIEFDPYEIAKTALRDEIPPNPPKITNPSIRKLSVKATTIQSSKGLASNYVFITHFDDQFLIKSKEKKMSDQDICNFLVALTRARTKVFLISSDSKHEPTFLSWMDKSRIEERFVTTVGKTKTDVLRSPARSQSGLRNSR